MASKLLSTRERELEMHIILCVFILEQTWTFKRNNPVPVSGFPIQTNSASSNFFLKTRGAKLRRFY